MKPYKWNKHISMKVIVVILSILFILSIIWLIYSVKNLTKSGELETNTNLRKLSTYTYNTKNVNNITHWMTFDYINTIFKLDPSYLKNALLIDDTRYPNIRIDNYARRHNINLPVFMQNIENIITNYSRIK